ncbi:MAG: hypothetical protein DMF62_02715 [Acidobacteria bacterium]|nr:MAG: hypothetical protein DMF62_02715 [Acidobacteriota bacterium]
MNQGNTKPVEEKNFFQNRPVFGWEKSATVGFEQLVCPLTFAGQAPDKRWTTCGQIPIRPAPLAPLE